MLLCRFKAHWQPAANSQHHLLQLLTKMSIPPLAFIEADPDLIFFKDVLKFRENAIPEHF